MKQYGLNALIASSPINVFYTSDLCQYGECYALLPYERSVEPAVVVPISISAPSVVMSPPWISDVRYYGEFYTETRWAEEPLTDSERRLVAAQRSWEKTEEGDPVAILIKLLRERGLTRGKIGVDESNLPAEHSFWQRLKSSLPQLELVRAEKIFSEIRMIKTDEEVRRFQKAVDITEEAWGRALEQAREGMTEREFSDIYLHTIISEGGRISSLGHYGMGMYGPPISFGRRTAFVDIMLPSDYKLKRGDLIRFDGGCSYMGYDCDMGRTAVLGQPTQKQRKYYDATLKGEELGIEMTKPGVKASDIFNAVMNAVRKGGISHYRRQNTGHGLAIQHTDPPRIGPKDQTPLEEGMVLCVETPYYEVGFGGLIVEDILLVTKKGHRRLTRSSRDLSAVGE